MGFVLKVGCMTTQPTETKAQYFRRILTTTQNRPADRVSVAAHVTRYRDAVRKTQEWVQDPVTAFTSEAHREKANMDCEFELVELDALLNELSG